MMDIFVDSLIGFSALLAAVGMVGVLLKMLGKDPNWARALAIVLGISTGRLVSDLIPLSGYMVYVAIGVSTAILVAAHDLLKKRRGPDA